MVRRFRLPDKRPPTSALCSVARPSRRDREAIDQTTDKQLRVDAPAVSTSLAVGSGRVRLRAPLIRRMPGPCRWDRTPLGLVLRDAAPYEHFLLCRKAYRQ